jgi:Ca2+-binding EF-hand superfamily protein
MVAGAACAGLPALTLESAMNALPLRVAGLALAVAIVPSIALAQARLPQNSEQRMAVLDANGDGTVSEDEYEDAITKTFRELDADRNNRVSADELAGASAPQQEGMLSPADRIRRIDMNTDGELTEEELERGAERAFQILDTNKDDALDIGELKSGGG